MRRTFFTLFTLLGLTMAPGSASAGNYTLPQLLERVRNEYAGVEAAREGKRVAEAQMWEANGLWFPTGGMNFGITGTPSVKCKGPGTTAMPSDNPTEREANCVQTDTVVTLNNAFNWSGVALHFDATLIQPIYTFGKIEAAREAAKAGKDAAEGTLAQARAEVSLQAARAYWGLKWARASLATLGDGRDRLADWVKRVDSAIEAGKSSYTETDLIRLKLALETVELAILDVQRARDLAVSALHVLTHDEKADIDNEEIDIRAVDLHPVTFYQDGASTHRPEARLLSAATRAVSAQRKLRISEMLPDLGVMGQLSYNLAQNVDNPNNSFMSRPTAFGGGVYLVARTTLDFGTKAAKYVEAEAQRRQVEAKRREALGGIALDIDRTYADAAEARKRAERSGHAEKIARGWYNAVDANLQAGVAESRDLVDAARNYFELRLKHLQAIMDVNVTQAALERAAGL